MVFTNLPISFRRRFLIPVATLLVAPLCSAAHFVAPGQIDVANILPAPPSADSLATRAELEIVVQLAKERTREQTASATNPPTGNVFAYAGPVIGSWFAADKLPLTAAFFAKIDEDGAAIMAIAKGIHPLRQRPFLVEPLIANPTSRPGGSTYPSGAGYNTAVWASVLAALFPEHTEALRGRARFACWTRVLAGVHYPTDNTGGRILGDAVAQFLLNRSETQAALAEVRQEIQGAGRR